MSFDTPVRKALQPNQISPVITKSLHLKRSVLGSKFQHLWGTFDIAVFLLLLAEVKTQYVQFLLVGENEVLHFFLIGVCVSFAFSGFINFAQAIQASYAGHTPALSQEQKSLMGITQTDSVTRMGSASTPYTATESPVGQQSLNFATLTSSTPSQQRSSPFTNSPYSSLLTSQQFNCSSGSLNTSQNTAQATLTGVYMSSQKPLSPVNQGSPGIQNLGLNLDGSGYLDSSGGGGSPFLRHRMSPFRTSLTPEEFMVDQRTLSSYLRSHYEKEQARTQKCSLDSSYGSSPGTWGLGKTILPTDISNELLKNVYQTATHSPKSPSSKKDDRDDAIKYAALEYWRKQGISSEHLTEWTARLRNWIAITLLSKLVEEIGKINSRLKKLGSPQVQVGESSLSSLRQIISSKGSQIPNLTRLLPYLEVANNQEYLVARLKKLASGYMSEFKWNEGGEFKGRSWADDLPTDCDIIIHMFCVYMNSHLPADPRHPDGKTFTSKYLVRTPDKIKSAPDGRLILNYCKINPPHFRVVSGETDYDVPQGRNNMFQALLLFLHHIKVKKDGMLGHANETSGGIQPVRTGSIEPSREISLRPANRKVNLGASGINILWILDGN